MQISEVFFTDLDDDSLLIVSEASSKDQASWAVLANTSTNWGANGWFLDGCIWPWNSRFFKFSILKCYLLIHSKCLQNEPILLADVWETIDFLKWNLGPHFPENEYRGMRNREESRRGEERREGVKKREGEGRGWKGRGDGSLTFASLSQPWMQRDY
jgi:hypothetical protein